MATPITNIAQRVLGDLKRMWNAVEITEECMLSGPNGWLRDVYGQAQLKGGGE